MKRFLLLFCTVVLVCSIMIVPAFAAEAYVGVKSSSSDHCVSFDSIPPSGEYIMSFEFDSDGSILTLIADPFVLGDVEEVFIDGNSCLASTAVPIFFRIEEAILELQFGILADSARSVVLGSFLDMDGNRYSLPDDIVVTLTPVGSSQSESPLTGIFDVFGGVGSWLAGQLGTTTTLFWNGQGLTFLGVLSVCALALAVVLLLVMVIVRFLRFRG